MAVEGCWRCWIPAGKAVPRSGTCPTCNKLAKLGRYPRPAFTLKCAVMQAVCVFLVCRGPSTSWQHLELASGQHWMAQQAAIGQGSDLPQLPPGQTCGLGDKAAEPGHVHTASQQLLKAQQVRRGLACSPTVPCNRPRGLHREFCLML